MSKSWSRRWRWPARLMALGGSGVAVWLVFRRVDRDALVATFGSMHLGWYLAAHAMFGLGLLGSAIRWHLMLRLNPAVVVHGAASVRMVFISQFFNTFFGGPSGGDMPKTAVYSRWYGVPAAEVLASSVLDRLVATVGGLIFTTGAVVAGVWSGAFGFLSRREVNGGGAGWLWGGAGLVLLGVAVVVAWGWRRPKSFVGRSLSAFRRSTGLLLASRRRAGHALLCAVLTAVLFNVTQILCLRAVSDAGIPLGQLLWLYQAVTVVASMPVTFAGAGLREGTAMVLLGPYGVPAATAVAGALLALSVHLAWAAFGAFLWMREQRLLAGRDEVRSDTGAASSVAAIVPTFNEVEDLAATVERLRRVTGLGEIVVSDGGSTDGTVALAARLGCVVVAAPRGRGNQLRAGVAATGAEVVLMVHADTWVPVDAVEALRRCLRDPMVAGGGFWKSFRDAPVAMRGARFRCWLRMWWGGRVLGDQAMFVRRSVLDAVGGVPEQPLMEEVELCRRLRREGRLALAGANVTTSIRRFRKHGILRTYWRMWRVTRAYRRGVTAEELVRMYERG